MWKIVGIGAFLLLLLLVVSFLYMRRCRAHLFRSVAAFTTSETALATAKITEYLTQYHPAVNHTDMDALIPILEDLLVRPFGYLKIDLTDNDASVFAVGSFIGDWVVKCFGGVWTDTTDAGPSVVFGSAGRSVTLYPVQKAAMIHEFREPGGLSAYLSSLTVMAHTFKITAS
jgi:hypothetical protein